MKGMFARIVRAAAVAGVCWAGMAWRGTARAEAAAAGTEPPAQVMEAGYLGQVAMHLYRWYLDENDFDLECLGDGDKLVFRVRRLPVEQDEGDKSEWAEIRIPQLNVGVHVKRPDYVIEELGLAVRSPHFRLIHGYKLEPGQERMPPEENWREVALDLDGMLEDLRTSALQATYPGPELTERLHIACRRQMELDPAGRESGEQVIHIGPMSPVANEVWVFLENQNLFMLFSSDSDIENPELWGAQELEVTTIDAAHNTLVSMEEMPGSNVYATRDQVGRLLYNCIVLGKRILVVNPDDPEEPALLREHVPAMQ